MFAEIQGISTADAVEIGLFIITLILVGITAWQACLTRRNVNAANKLIELQTEPSVYIGARWERKVSLYYYQRPQQPSFELLVFIQNRGGGPARNIKVVDVKDDLPAGNYDFPAGTFLVNGELMQLNFKETPFGKGEVTKELVPDQEMPLARVHSGAVSKLEYSVEVVFTYETSLGKSKHGSNVLDFPFYRNSPSPIY